MTEEPGGLPSTGSQRVGHDLATEHTLEGEDLGKKSGGGPPGCLGLWGAGPCGPPTGLTPRTRPGSQGL